jgi:hypothetical protein
MRATLRVWVTSVLVKMCCDEHHEENNLADFISAHVDCKFRKNSI